MTEALVAASRIDLGDHFEFAIVRANQTEAGGGGGVRFRIWFIITIDLPVLARQLEQILGIDPRNAGEL